MPVELFMEQMSRLQDNLTTVSTDVTAMTNCKQAENKIQYKAQVWLWAVSSYSDRNRDSNYNSCSFFSTVPHDICACGFVNPMLRIVFV